MKQCLEISCQIYITYFTIARGLAKTKNTHGPRNKATNNDNDDNLFVSTCSLCFTIYELWRSFVRTLL